jgi:uncharacterized protein YbjT (DUF2867 family)
MVQPAKADVKAPGFASRAVHRHDPLLDATGATAMARVLIVGATGLVGTLALAQALADQRVSRVIALTRRPIAPADKLQNVVVDFADLPVTAEYWSVDGVICALGTTRAQTSSPDLYRQIDHDYPLAVARLARTHGATRFALTSSLGADAHSRFAYPRIKGELEDALKALGFPSLTIIRPSVLEGPRAQPRFGERMASIALRVLGPALPRQWRISPATSVAAALLEGAVAAAPGIHVRTNEDM